MTGDCFRSTVYGRKSMLFDRCPGAANIRTPTLTIKKCPKCGEEIEIFSNDVSVTCQKCGFVVYNDILSCVQWCKYASECVGEETYSKLTAEKPQDQS
jgi:ribosomal protein S27E